MDSLTHLAAGALTPVIFPHAPKRTTILWFGIAVGELPDIDVLFSSSSVEGFLTLHRGITHALIMQPLLVLIAVLPFFFLLNRKKSPAPLPCLAPAQPPIHPASYVNKGFLARLFYRWYNHSGGGSTFGIGSMFLAALFAAYTHLYLDCMTTFGTQIFLPFSDQRVGMPAMFIVDLFLTIPLLILCYLAWRQKPVAAPATTTPPNYILTSQSAFGYFSKKSRIYAAIGLLWVFVYPMISLGINEITAHRFAASVTAKTETSDALFTSPVFPSDIALLTEPFSPFAWKAIVDGGKTYRMNTIFTASLDGNTPMNTYAKPEALLYETLKQQHPLFAQFESFCSFMVQEERPVSPVVQMNYSQTITEYSFSDLRYIMTPKSPARWFRQGATNFMLQARVTEQGTLVAYRFVKMGRAASETPWEPYYASARVR